MAVILETLNQEVPDGVGLGEEVEWDDESEVRAWLFICSSFDESIDQCIIHSFIHSFIHSSRSTPMTTMSTMRAMTTGSTTFPGSRCASLCVGMLGATIEQMTSATKGITQCTQQ